MHALAPWNWGEDLQGLGNIGMGLASKAGIIDQGNAAAQKQHQAGVNAIGKMYGDRYGSWQGFKRTLANDPFAIGSDIASVATLPLGGEGLVSKIPDATEAMLLAGAGAAKQGAGLSNTLLNAAVHVPGAMRAAGSIAKPVLQRARWADPAYAASQVAGKTVNVGRRVGQIPVVGRAVKGAIGAGIGHTVGGFLPFIGHTGGTIIGEHVAEGMLGPGGPGWLSRGVNAGAKTLPAWSTVGGAEQMPPSEQGAPPGGAPGHGPEGDAPPGPAAATGQGAGTGDPLLDAINDSSLGASDGGAAPADESPTPSSGLQGAPSATPMRAPRGGMFTAIANWAHGLGAVPGEVATLLHIAKTESSGNPGATSPSGRYHGLFQYQNSAGPEADTARALGDMRANSAKLARLGVNPDTAALYVMHQQGPGGGPALLTAPPGTNAVDALTPAYHGNRALARQAIAHNIGIKDEAQANAAAENMTAADFVNLWRKKLGGASFADGGRVGYAEGGNVIDMTEKLMQRAEAHHKASQQATKPLLGLSDSTVAQALKVAQRGI
jgi:hypothetical protein